jgi:hypothetical protein
MMVSGAVTMMLLPAIFIVMRKRLFPSADVSPTRVKEKVVNN